MESCLWEIRRPHKSVQELELRRDARNAATKRNACSFKVEFPLQVGKLVGTFNAGRRGQQI
jgi:hypothetical protein